MNSNVCDNETNNTQEIHFENKEDLNVPMIKKYITNREEPNECLKNPKMEVNFNNGKLSNVTNVFDTLKEVQWKIVDHKDGDGLKLNNENKIQLETMEKEFEGLKIQNEFIVDTVQLITNSSKFRNDQIKMIKDQTNKVQNEIENIHNRKIKKELENVINFKTIIDKFVGIHSNIDQFKLMVSGLETAVEVACENKKIMTEIMEVSEYMKNQYYLQMTENQMFFAEQISENVSEIDQLKADVGVKANEVNELEKRCTDQRLCIDLHQKLMKCVENYIADLLSTIFSYIKQLEKENDQLAVPNESQKEIPLLLAKQLEDIYGIIRTRNDQDMTYDMHTQFMDKHVENVNE